MTEAELDQYISNKLGQRRSSSLNFSDWRDLRARYHWIGEKLFDMGTSCDPCFLTCSAFIIFALDPSIERLRSIQMTPTSEHIRIFKKLAESNPNLPWDDAYEYFDDTRYYQFNVLRDYLTQYRDQLLQIDTSNFPSGKRLVAHQKVPNHIVKELLSQKLQGVNSSINYMTKKEIETAISRYRWFGDELFHAYENDPLRIFTHSDTRFLAQILYPSTIPDKLLFDTSSKINFQRDFMTCDEKIKYDIPEPNRPWGQIWGYVESRPTSVPEDTREAIKLQFRNQFSHSYDMI